MAMRFPLDDSQNERFHRRGVGRPFLEAAVTLAEQTGKSLDDLEQMTLGDIFNLAVAVHGEQLPEFWQTWLDWHTPQPIQPLGDLDS